MQLLALTGDVRFADLRQRPLSTQSGSSESPLSGTRRAAGWALPLRQGASAEVIEERLKAAKAVVVVWSANAVMSQWVRGGSRLGDAVGGKFVIVPDPIA